MDKDSFIFYKNWYDGIVQFPEEMQPQIYNLIIRYALFGEEPDKNTAYSLRAFFYGNVKQAIDCNERKREATIERRKEAGRLGGIRSGENRKSKQTKQMLQNRSKTKQNEANEAVNVNVNVNDNVNVINNKEIVKEKNTTQFKPPSLEEVRTYILEKNYQVDAEAFVAYYDSNGWMVGRNKMKNWKSALVTWQKKEIQYKSNNNNTYDRRQQAKQATLARQNAAIDRIIEEESLLWEQQQQLSDGGSIEGIQASRVH